MQLLVLILVLLILVLPILTFGLGRRIGKDRRIEAQKLEILDRMERAELSNQPDLAQELGRIYSRLDP